MSEAGVVSKRQYVPDTEEERILVRKLDKRIVPVIFLMYIMSYLDRANIGNARTGGMQAELGFNSEQYSVILLVFFVGYVLGEVPSNMLLTRSRPSIFLPSLMIVWGAISMCMAACTSWQTVTVVRAVLGVAEAGFSPGVLFLLSCWYKKSELARRFCIYYTASALSGALGGLLAGAITGNLNGKGGISGWKWLFIIEGAATIAASGIGYYFLPDYPANTRWLNEDEKWLASARLESEDVGVAAGEGATHGHWASLKQALSDWRTWCCVVLFMMITGAQTIQYFIPTLMLQLGYTGVTAQYMTIPVYMVAVVFILVIPFSSDIFKERGYHLATATGLAVLSFAVILGTPNLPKVQYVFLCFAVGGIYSGVPIMLTWVSNIICWPAEKRAVAQAFVNAMGNSASIYGSFVWPSSTSPRYIPGFATTMAMMAVCMFGAIILKFLVAKFPFVIPEEHRYKGNDVAFNGSANHSNEEIKGETREVETLYGVPR